MDDNDPHIFRFLTKEERKMRAFTFTLLVFFSSCVTGEELSGSEFGDDYFSDLSDFDFGIVSEDMKHDKCCAICITSTAMFFRSI